jgi:hypothetical protein
METIFHYLESGFSLQTTGIILGLALLACHGLALVKESHTRSWITGFARNVPIGRVLLTIIAAWCWILVKHQDMGEFENLRSPLLILIPLLFLGAFFYMEEFLSVRSLGVLLLLAAGPVLQSAFMKPEPTRLLLPALCYAWIILGLFWVGKPYLFRDWAAWVSSNATRWRVLCFAGLAYGTATLACAVLFWGKVS